MSTSKNNKINTELHLFLFRHDGNDQIRKNNSMGAKLFVEPPGKNSSRQIKPSKSTLAFQTVHLSKFPRRGGVTAAKQRLRIILLAVGLLTSPSGYCTVISGPRAI